MTRIDEQDPWQVLGLAPGANPEEIRHAFERLSTLLTSGSLSLYAAAEPEEQRQLQQRLRDAYVRLVGDQYSHEVPPEGGESTGPRSAEAALESGAEPATEPTASSSQAEEANTVAEFSGPRLRAIREEAGVSLRELSDRTRIRPQQLVNLEEEAWDAIPPRVYVRGFVMAYARALKLDADQVWASFEKRWRRARPAPG